LLSQAQSPAILLHSAFLIAGFAKIRSIYASRAALPAGWAADGERHAAGKTAGRMNPVARDSPFVGAVLHANESLKKSLLAHPDYCICQNVAISP
jgi:hypothetical protein